ncbi:enoyl-CoA hydratase/isomerase family protein [Cryobacterium frigoriphilum]|uniref:Enoyl-CoA hydratase/isomerase family protein n=1 Tax=Cryobacterium frigoriphilum TaxID=1259150 RepID=A0A4R8ZUI9_9MICO|nr:enoyl-CoA hydratase/isomerase family protein [Cryobacterium frigoriphilum]TFD45984.1 enoyl-CoA hydratase/isomerase family protein [Cryobacterium frigoriphilum]
MSERVLEVAIVGGVTSLTFNRPDEANALSLELANAFRDAVTSAVVDPDCHVVVLAGNGRFFCSGGDVIGMAQADDPARFTRLLADTMHEALLELATSSLIVVAAVQGPAAGAGLGIVLNADLVVATDRAAFIGAYGVVGLSPDCGVSYLLPRAIGPLRASSMLLAGQTVGPSDALAWGLINEIVEQESLAAHVAGLAARIAGGATQSLGATKRLLAAGSAVGYAAHLKSESESIAALAGHADTRSRVSAFASRSKSTSRS